MVASWDARKCGRFTAGVFYREVRRNVENIDERRKKVTAGRNFV